jgi:hypothetical protein
MIEAAGSPLGILGIATMPAPRRPRPLEEPEDPVRAVPVDRAVGRLPAAVAAEVARDVACDAVPAGDGAVPQTSQ